MICQQCGREAAPEAKFCVDCGSPLELRCPACQTSYELGSRFCSLCGRSLPDGPSTEQQKPAEKADVLDQFDGTQQSEFPAQASRPFQAEQKPNSCPRCHQRNELDADYCFACGMPLDDYQYDDLSDIATRSFAADSPAGFWVRLLAYLIDGLILGFASIVIVVVLMGDFPSFIIESSNFNNLVMLLTIVYNTALIAICATTGGKHQFRLSVIRTDGSRIGPGRALARSLFTGLSALFLGLGFLMIAFREDKRGLHDLICDTKVVRRHRPTS